MDIKRFVNKFSMRKQRNVFRAVVKCSECGEEVRVRIEFSSDFQAEYNQTNPEHCYTIKKEIIGKNCYNLMKLSLALTREAKLLFADKQGCEFITFERETG
ncbi:MAG: hypothetical protein KKC66_02460 [Candidatus Omnitrophica bacterium]|nr:hypothetical protein [Candidatus Omnitrophota bacterium]MBU1932746.1 hypothetical protein [Candidatus Omnitrophota bacterium]